MKNRNYKTFWTYIIYSKADNFLENRAVYGDKVKFQKISKHIHFMYYFILINQIINKAFRTDDLHFNNYSL